MRCFSLRFASISSFYLSLSISVTSNVVWRYFPSGESWYGEELVASHTELKMVTSRFGQSIVAEIDDEFTIFLPKRIVKVSQNAEL